MADGAQVSIPQRLGFTVRADDGSKIGPQRPQDGWLYVCLVCGCWSTEPEFVR
jgi:hypothetical protein